jgi:hypothetical protein
MADYKPHLGKPGKSSGTEYKWVCIPAKEAAEEVACSILSSGYNRNLSKSENDPSSDSWSGPEDMDRSWVYKRNRRSRLLGLA